MQKCIHRLGIRMRSVCASRTLTIESVIVGVVSYGRKTKVRRSVQRAKFSCSKLLKILSRLKMAKRCQEEYEDVSEPFNTVNTLYVRTRWPRLNVCLVSAKLSLYTSLLRQSVRLSPLPYSLLRQCPFSLYRSPTLHFAHDRNHGNRSDATAPCPAQLKRDGYI